MVDPPVVLEVSNILVPLREAVTGELPLELKEEAREKAGKVAENMRQRLQADIRRDLGQRSFPPTDYLLLSSELHMMERLIVVMTGCPHYRNE